MPLSWDYINKLPITSTSSSITVSFPNTQEQDPDSKIVSNAPDNIWVDWKPEVEDVTAKLPNLNIPYIKRVHFNRETGHTAIEWMDGSKSTVVRCGEGENFEPYAGFCAAIVKKLFGSTSAAKHVMDDLDADQMKARKEEQRVKRIAEQKELEEKNHARKIRSMVKRMELAKEASDAFIKKNDVDKAINAVVEKFVNGLMAGDEDGDSAHD